jgi:threonine dehydrogenase-like Zn-dependent dehydrogenase
MQQVVTRELTVQGAYGFTNEFGRAIEAIRTGRIDVSPLIEGTAPLEEGSQIVDDLAKGKMDAIKIVLKLEANG